VPAARWTVGSGLLFALLVLAWGGNYLFVRVAELSVAPLWAAAFRAGIGALGLGVFLLAQPATGTFSAADRRDAMLLGLPNTGIFLALWFVAAPYVAPGEAAVVIYTFPLWVALFSPAILGARLAPTHWIGVVFGFTGVVLVSQPWLEGSGGLPVVPLLELLAAAILWAFATVGFQRRFAPSALARANGYQLLAGALFLLAASAVAGVATRPPAEVSFWVAVLWLGLYGTAFAYGVWFFLLRTHHASSLSAYSFLVPLTALALSVVFEGESVNVPQAFGVLAVVVGIYLVGRHPLAHPRGGASGGVAS